MHKEKINKNLSYFNGKYEKLANHDMLTGLPNRMAFKEDLIKYFGDNKQFSVFCLILINLSILMIPTDIIAEIWF